MIINNSRKKLLFLSAILGCFILIFFILNFRSHQLIDRDMHLHRNHPGLRHHLNIKNTKRLTLSTDLTTQLARSVPDPFRYLEDEVRNISTILRFRAHANVNNNDNNQQQHALAVEISTRLASETQMSFSALEDLLLGDDPLEDEVKAYLTEKQNQEREEGKKDKNYHPPHPLHLPIVETIQQPFSTNLLQEYSEPVDESDPFSSSSIIFSPATFIDDVDGVHQDLLGAVKGGEIRNHVLINKQRNHNNNDKHGHHHRHNHHAVDSDDDEEEKRKQVLDQFEEAQRKEISCPVDYEAILRRNSNINIVVDEELENTHNNNNNEKIQTTNNNRLQLYPNLDKPRLPDEALFCHSSSATSLQMTNTNYHNAGTDNQRTSLERNSILLRNPDAVDEEDFYESLKKDKGIVIEKNLLAFSNHHQHHHNSNNGISSPSLSTFDSPFSQDDSDRFLDPEAHNFDELQRDTNAKIHHQYHHNYDSSSSLTMRELLFRVRKRLYRSFKKYDREMMRAGNHQDDEDNNNNNHHNHDFHDQQQRNSVVPVFATSCYSFLSNESLMTDDENSENNIKNKNVFSSCESVIKNVILKGIFQIDVDGGQRKEFQKQQLEELKREEERQKRLANERRKLSDPQFHELPPAGVVPQQQEDGTVIDYDRNAKLEQHYHYDNFKEIDERLPNQNRDVNEKRIEEEEKNMIAIGHFIVVLNTEAKKRKKVDSNNNRRRKSSAADSMMMMSNNNKWIKFFCALEHFFPGRFTKFHRPMVLSNAETWNLVIRNTMTGKVASPSRLRPEFIFIARSSFGADFDLNLQRRFDLSEQAARKKKKEEKERNLIQKRYKYYNPLHESSSSSSNESHQENNNNTETIPPSLDGDEHDNGEDILEMLPSPAASPLLRMIRWVYASSKFSRYPLLLFNDDDRQHQSSSQTDAFVYTRKGYEELGYFDETIYEDDLTIFFQKFDTALLEFGLRAVSKKVTALMPRVFSHILIDAVEKEDDESRFFGGARTPSQLAKLLSLLPLSHQLRIVKLWNPLEYLHKKYGIQNFVQDGLIAAESSGTVITSSSTSLTNNDNAALTSVSEQRKLKSDRFKKMKRKRKLFEFPFMSAEILRKYKIESLMKSSLNHDDDDRDTLSSKTMTKVIISHARSFAVDPRHRHCLLNDGIGKRKKGVGTKLLSSSDESDDGQCFYDMKRTFKHAGLLPVDFEGL